MHRFWISVMLFLCIQDFQFGHCKSYCAVTVLQNGEFVFPVTTQQWSSLKARYVNETKYIAAHVFSVEDPGSRLFVRCRRPYIFNGNDYTELVAVTCDKGQWNPLPHCLEQSCMYRPPPRVKYAILETLDFKSGAILNYTCHPDFYKVQKGEIKCIDGAWVGEIPFCRYISASCRDKPHPQVRNAKSTSISRGHILTYTCDEGYYKAEYGTVKCVEGNWRGKLPVCKESRCYINGVRFPGIMPPQHGIYLHDDALSHRCINGYKSSVEGNGVMRCFNGEWKGAVPPCVSAARTRQCPKLEKTEGLIINYTDDRQVKMNSKAMLHCDERYKRRGEAIILCQTDGSWSDPPAYCIPPTCEYGSVYDILPVSITLDLKKLPEMELPKGISLEIKCRDENYDLVGDHVVKCTETGQWSIGDAKCILRNTTLNPETIECPELERTEGLIITYTNGRQISSTAMFHCNLGFRLNNAESIICQPNGLWSESPAYCIRRPRSTTSSPDTSGCEFITKANETAPIIITDRKEIYKFGEHVMFVCPRGKRLVPDIERVICMGSGWSDDFPECHIIPR